MFVDRSLKDILKDAVQNKASGILFTNGNKPYFNYDGKWVPSKKDRPMDFIEVQEILWQVMDLKLQNMFFSAKELNFQYSLRNIADFGVEVEKNNDRLKAEFSVVKQFFYPEQNVEIKDVPEIKEVPDIKEQDLEQISFSDQELAIDLDTIDEFDLNVLDEKLFIEPEPAEIILSDPVFSPAVQKSKIEIKPVKQTPVKIEKKVLAVSSTIKPRCKHKYVATLVDILRAAYHNNVSDVHIGCDSPPLFRKDGFLKKASFPRLNSMDTEALLTEIINDDQYNELLKERELDIGFSIPECRLRGNICFEMGRMAGVFRLIPPGIKTLDELKTPKVFKALMNKHKGLILFTGPTGSGKSTSLAAMVDYANKRSNYHILTIEDPIEFIHNPIKARITHRELGRDTLSFAEGLKRALRQDPDIILVGEMRDLETIQLAIMASETGHLVLSTLHTSSAAKSIHRIIDVFPPHQQSQIRMTLSENLLAIVSQTLIPRKDKKGREAAFEILINTNAVSNLIREEKVFQIPTIIETQSHLGMIAMDQSLYNLVKSDVIDYKEALSRVTDQKIFKTKLKKGGIIEEVIKPPVK